MSPVHTGCEVDAQDYRIPEQLFAGEPRGKYQTGTFEELWIDASRAEATTSDPNDKRRLMVQIWYPASYRGNPERARYVTRRELYLHEELDGWLDQVGEVRTNSVWRAPVVEGSEQFPILIYNPGGGEPHFSATYQTEFLASYGYVVVAIGHTGLNRIARFPDGYVYKPDLNDPRVNEAEHVGLSDVERFRLRVARYAQVMMPVHVRDISFVLDRLRVLNVGAASQFRGRLDLERVGVLGWSLGGALALQASRDEPRIRAAANLDGWRTYQIFRVRGGLH